MGSEREHELGGILATTADRLNTALRETGQTEMVGDPYRSLAIRDGIASLYDRAAKWREERDALRARVAELEERYEEAVIVRRDRISALEAGLRVLVGSIERWETSVEGVIGRKPRTWIELAQARALLADEAKPAGEGE